MTGTRGSSIPSVRDILSVVFKHWRKIAVVFAATMVPVVVKIVLDPPAYQATAKVLLKREEANVPVGENYFRLAQEEEINSELEIVKSRPVVEQVYFRWKAKFSSAVDGVNDELPQDDERGLQRIGKHLTVEPVEKANVILIRSESQDPVEAAWLANAVAETYVSYHVKVHTASQAEAFFAERLRATKAQLDSLENLLKTFQEAEGLVSYPKQETIVLDKLKNFDERLTEVRQEILTRQVKLDQLRQLLSGNPERVVPTREIEDHPLVMELQKQLITLRLKRNELLEKYTVEHRLVRDVQDQIAKAQTELRVEVARIIQLEEATLNSLQAEERALGGMVQNLLNEVRTLPHKGLTIDRLTLAIEDTKRIYSLLMQKYEEAKIAEVSDPRVAKVKIIESAAVPTQPNGPGRKRNLLLGFLLATSISLGMAFTTEFFDDSFSNKDQVEARLNLPVLATFEEHKKLNRL